MLAFERLEIDRTNDRTNLPLSGDRTRPDKSSLTLCYKEIFNRTETGQHPLSVRPLPLGGADTGQTGQKAFLASFTDDPMARQERRAAHWPEPPTKEVEQTNEIL